MQHATNAAMNDGQAKGEANGVIVAKGAILAVEDNEAGPANKAYTADTDGKSDGKMDGGINCDADDGDADDAFMQSAQPEDDTRERPYWLPQTVKYETIPPAIRQALRQVVQPVYDATVVVARTALERSAGVSLTFLLALEVLRQLEMAQALDFSGDATANDADRQRLERSFADYLKLVREKQKVADAIHRLREHSRKRGQLQIIPGMRKVADDGYGV